MQVTIPHEFSVLLLNPEPACVVPAQLTNVDNSVLQSHGSQPKPESSPQEDTSKKRLYLVYDLIVSISIQLATSLALSTKVLTSSGP